MRDHIRKAVEILWFGIVIFLCSGVSPSVKSFNNGKVTPLFEPRFDQGKYTSSCRTVENMFVTVQGPVSRRPGTRYIAADGTNQSEITADPAKVQIMNSYNE